MVSENLIPAEEAKAVWQEFLIKLDELNMPVADNLQQQAERVFSLSQFVSRQCQRNPEALAELIQSGRLEQPLSLQQMQNLLAEKVQSVITEQQLSTVLRQFRNQQMLAIYWRDLLDVAPVKETCQQVSNLADTCIQQANQWLHKKIAQEMRLPEAQALSQQLIVIGMGKLGGNELNVSSDIDLIFCFRENGPVNPEQPHTSFEKFFNMLGRRLIKILDQVTADGFVFRVDMRLRPYGDSGPLVMSFAALEEYYQDQGRDWERFALIKARVITGTEADKKQLHGLLKPFIFRRYIDYSVLESPRQMKNLINQELRRRNLNDNIKLGPGGIREVEFIAQALQLIHGGKEPMLQCRSLFQSLPRLAELELLSEATVAELMESYLFLRRVEHRLQANKDQQTQALPTEENDQLLLAHSLEFDDWQGFRQQVASRMETIHQHFSVLFRDSSQQPLETEADIIFNDVWQEFLSMETDVESILELAGFQNVSDIAEQLISFKESSAVRHMGPRGAKRLDQLMPLILQTMVTLEQQSESLKRILRLLSSISKRTAYLEILAENKGALKQMIQLCSASARIADQIADYPYVLDELLNPNTLYHPPEIGRFPDMLRQSLCRIPEDDPELQMDCLREFRQINLLRVTAADIAGALTVRQVSRYLTVIAETVIESVVQFAWHQLSKKHGVPQSGVTLSAAASVTGDGESLPNDSEQPEELASENRVQGFAIIAYGKLGGHELGYGSDLDLVFLHDAEQGMTDGDKPIENGIFYMRLAQKVIHLLSIRTRSGVLYEVDMRLRPSGNSGLLVSHIDAFSDYQNESAWTWEHQALIRGRCILGSVSLREQFEKVRSATLCRKRNQQELCEQVIMMREKMRDNLLKPNLAEKGLFDLKQSRGGITDIEFLTQYLVLKLAADEPSLVISSNTSELLSYLARKDNLSDPRLKALVRIYAELRRLINLNALQNHDNTVDVAELADVNIALVIQLWDDLLLNAQIE